MPNLDYNSATTSAVRLFQMAHSASHVTGVVDNQTWELFKLYGGCATGATKRTIDSAPLVSPTLVTKSTVALLNTQAKSLLYELHIIKKKNVTATQLKAAIKKFQRQNKLIVTGKVSKKLVAELQKKMIQSNQ